MKKFLTILLTSILLLLVFSCEDPSNPADPSDPSDPIEPTSPVKVNAVAPLIASELSNIYYEIGEEVATPLSVTATVTDSGALTYQWYSNDEANTDTPTLIEGETNATLTPSTAEIGIQHYFVVITNTIVDNGDGGIKTTSTTSKLVTISVTNPKSHFAVNGNSITGYTGPKTGVVVIPRSIGGNTITNIAKNAFRFTDITSIIFPDSLLTIESEAIYSCQEITTFTIPASVKKIEISVFGNCPKLESIEVESGNTEYISIEGNLYTKDKKTLLIFSNNKQVGNFIIPNSVTEIGAQAFSGCDLTSITIPNSVTTIGSSAFSGCTSLTSIIIPNSVTSIGSYAFSGCTRLTSISIPNSVTSIGSESFDDCTDLQEIKVDSGNTAYMEIDGVLFTHDQKTILSYPLGKTENSYSVPQGVTTIGDSLFLENSVLTALVIPDSVLTIGYPAFYRLKNLVNITFHAVNPPTIKYGAIFNLCFSLQNIYVPKDSVEAYSQKYGDSIYAKGKFKAIPEENSNS